MTRGGPRVILLFMTTIPAPAETNQSAGHKLTPLALAALANGVALEDVQAYAAAQNRTR